MRVTIVSGRVRAWEQPRGMGEVVVTAWYRWLWRGFIGESGVVLGFQEAIVKVW